MRTTAEGAPGWACPHGEKPMKLRTIVIRQPVTTQVVSGLLRATWPPEGAGDPTGAASSPRFDEPDFSYDCIWFRLARTLG